MFLNGNLLFFHFALQSCAVFVNMLVHFKSLFSEFDTFHMLFHHRLPFWTQLREAEPHDTETQPPTQPCSPVKPRRHPAQPNSSSSEPNGHSDSTCPARPDTSSDKPNSDWPSCTSSLPACTSWNPAKPGHPTLRTPYTALSP